MTAFWIIYGMTVLVALVFGIAGYADHYGEYEARRFARQIILSPVWPVLAVPAIVEVARDLWHDAFGGK